MNHRDLRLAAWPHVAVIACVLLIAGCQDGSGPGLVTSPEGKPAYEAAKPPPTPPPAADPAIAYVVQRANGDSELKVMNADGSNQTTIFTGTWLLNTPSWSPDGQSLTFAWNGDLWLIDVEVVGGVPTGSNARVLLDRSENLFSPAWSPLGDRIAFVDVALRTIETIDPATREEVVLYSSPSGGLSSPTWNADATKIAFVEGGAVRVLDLGSASVTTVLESAWGQQFSGGPGALDWARTQDALAFSVGSERGHDLAVYVMQLPGTPTFVVAGAGPTWSPNDQGILFVGRQGFSKIDLATGQITRVGSTGMWPDWRRF